MSSPTDPLRQLQSSARRAGRQILPGSRVARVVVLDDAGRKIVDAAVPPGSDSVAVEPDHTPAGWVVTDSSASFDGKPVRVSASRLGLLRLLIEADGPIAAEQLAKGWGSQPARTSEDNVRYHVRELNKEIRAVFPDLDFAPVEGSGDGYELRFR